MALKFKDAVLYVTKSPDGTISRVNAIVLRSALHAPIGVDRRPIKDVPEEEHVDLAFPASTVQPKSNDVDGIFRVAVAQRRFVDGLSSGWENEPGIALASEIVEKENALAAATRSVQELSAEVETLHKKIAEQA